jgi:ribulose kinase
VRGIAIVEVQAKTHHAKNVTQGKEMDRNIEKKFIKENEKDENVLQKATRYKKP